MKRINISSSKSDAHRALICQALLKEPCEVLLGDTSDDIEATRRCLAALLSEKRGKTGVDLYCGESGATLRFLIPLVGALGVRGIFHPVGRLSKRPLEPLAKELISHGMQVSDKGDLPLIVEGQLQPGEFNIDGGISSQFITGLLLSLPLLEGPSRVNVIGELQSASYVDMTLYTLKKFGIDITCEKHEGAESNMVSISYLIPGNQKYKSPGKYEVEGDWSNGSFWITAGILGKEPIEILGLNLDSFQGDKKILEIIRDFGGKVESSEEGIIAYPAKGSLKAITVSAGNTPDIVPEIALLAAQAKGTTRILNVKRLRMKESDRMSTIASSLRRLGCKVEELEDELLITGGNQLTGGLFDSFRDHRIAMMLAVASLISKGKVKILGWEAVNKSYPTFFDRMESLGLSDNLELV